VSTLVRHGDRDDDDLEAMHSRMTRLEATLGERVAEVEIVKADLERFRIRYRQEVGLLHDQLDKLELAIAEAELGELSKKLEDSGAAESPPPPAARAPAQPRFTSDAVRKLFRDVAKTIHPDLARDQVARDRRHALMIEANRAYALGDEEQLRGILEAWERSPEAVQGTNPEATRLRLARRASQIEDQLEALAADLADLKGTPLWQLKAMVDEAAIRGKDIVRDMVQRLKRDIMAATNRLDAMRPPQ
jgi:ABC-type phosphate transport system auxiliary subunit